MTGPTGASLALTSRWSVAVDPSESMHSLDNRLYARKYDVRHIA